MSRTLSRALTVSDRAMSTEPPVILKTKQLMAQAPAAKEVMSLAQGVVFWPPPPEATELGYRLMCGAAGHEAAPDDAGGSGDDAKVSSATGGMAVVYGDGGVHSYGPSDGLPALTEALRQKIRAKNGLEGYEVMVTNGANQAVTNVVLALCDSADKVVLFKPYYFNHLMALQMTGGAPRVVLGPCEPDSLHPDLDWLAEQLRSTSPPRAVIVVDPNNPTGVLLPAEKVRKLASMCADAGAWLLLDATYEDFVFDGRVHTSVCAANVVQVFSFSKGYGMMGWRVGYIAYPGQAMLDAAGLGDCKLGDSLMKIQDTIAICASQLSQHMALAALQHGDAYLAKQVDSLKQNRQLIADALEPLGPQGVGWVGGEGAIYFWAKLPERFAGPVGADAPSGAEAAAAGAALPAGTDEDVVAWLIKHHGVCVIPGSACGTPGYLRVAYANVKPAQCAVAAARLKRGLAQLVQMDSVLF